MSKLARHQAIIELAHDGPLPNQQELCKVLGKRGFRVTQATLSRDLNELRLVKTADGYVLPNGESPSEGAPALSRVVREFVREARRAQNLLVIKTISGGAQPVAVALDRQNFGEAGGTIAGGDTLLIVTANNRHDKTLHTAL